MYKKLENMMAYLVALALYGWVIYGIALFGKVIADSHRGPVLSGLLALGGLCLLLNAIFFDWEKLTPGNTFRAVCGAILPVVGIAMAGPPGLARWGLSLLALIPLALLAEHLQDYQAHLCASS